MIKELLLTNFRQHRELHVEFTKGLNLLQGDNGSGKTGVLKGILYALGGASLAGSKEHLTTWGSKDPMSVYMAIQVGGKNLEIIRDLNSAVVTDAETQQVLASGQIPATRYLEDELGMDMKTLKTLLCAEQGDAQGLLKMGASGLQARVEAVSNVEIIDKVLRHLTAANSAYTAELNGIGELADLTEVHNRFLDVHAHISDTTISMQKSSEMLKSQAEERADLVSRLRMLTAEVQEAKDTDSKLSALQTRLFEKLNDQAVLAPTGTDVQLDELAIEISRLREELAQGLQINREIDYYEQELGQAERDLSRATQAHADLLSKKDLVQRVLALNTEILDLKVAKQDVEVELFRLGLELETGICAGCKRSFDDFDPEPLRKKIAELQLRVIELEGDMSTKSVEFSQLTAQGVTASFALGYQSTLETIANALNAASQKYRVFKTSIHPGTRVDTFALQTRITELVSQHTEMNRNLIQLRKLDTEISTIQDQIEQLEATPAASADIQELQIQLGITQEAVNNLNESIHLLQVDIEKAQVSIPALEREKGMLEQIIADTEAKAKRAEQLRIEQDNVQQLSKFLRENRDKLLQESWDGLIQYTSQLLESTTEGLMQGLRRDSRGDFYLEEAGKDVPVDELSGARKSIVGICLRLGLSNVFFGPQGFTLLDEPTADCTDANAALVAGLLRSLPQQVIMVSHRLGDAANADNVIVTGV